MKNLVSILLLGFIMVLTSCGDNEECMDCTGTTVNGEAADFTICKNDDDTTTRTNNITNTVVTDSVGYAEGVAFYESGGLSCK